MLDFDGTVTSDDATDILLDRFARKQWDELKLRAGGAYAISHMDMLTNFSRLLPDDKEMLVKFLMRSMSFRQGFREFVGWAQSKDYGLAIASNGFGFYVSEMLDRAGIRGITVYSNDICFTSPPKGIPGRPNPRCSLCPTCKVLCVKDLRERYSCVAYVGDGFGDRFAAVHAGIIFARDHLRDFCFENGIKHFPWWSFYDIMRETVTGLTPAYVNGRNLCPVEI